MVGTGTLDKIAMGEFLLFADELNFSRVRALLSGESFVDDSAVWAPMVRPYKRLIDSVSCPSVTEYAGSFPVLSLYLLSQGRLDYVRVISDNASLLRQLECARRDLKLSVELVEGDVNSIHLDPIGAEKATDLGVSFAGLYSRSSRPVVQESCHSGFGVFMCRPIPRTAGSPVDEWSLRDDVLAQMSVRYARIASNSFPRVERVIGFMNNSSEPCLNELVEVQLDYIIGAECENL